MQNNEATTASKIVSLLEDAYKVLQDRTPDLPEVFFKLDHGRTLNAQVWGHFSPNAWTADGAPRHEVMIASECLAAGAEQVLQTLIHEAVHALAEARGVKETSRQGRYHNKRFIALAEELGLTYDTPRNYVDGKLVPDERIGWSHVVMTQETTVRYMGVLDLLRKEITAYRGTGKFQPRGVKRQTYAYAIFATEDGLDVHQMGTTKYEGLKGYLQDHYSMVSSLTQAEVTDILTEEGHQVVGAQAGHYYMGDILDAHPEVQALLQELAEA